MESANSRLAGMLLALLCCIQTEISEKSATGVNVATITTFASRSVREVSPLRSWTALVSDMECDALLNCLSTTSFRIDVIAGE